MPSGASVVRTQIFISPACQLGKDINFFEFLLGPRLDSRNQEEVGGDKENQSSHKYSPEIGQD